MGYYLQESMSASSPGTPKTHTPVPPTQERGLRYYIPEIGRWINRDPIWEEAAGRVALAVLLKSLSWKTQNMEYQFVNNDAPNRVDYLGLNELGHVTCVENTKKATCTRTIVLVSPFPYADPVKACVAKHEQFHIDQVGADPKADYCTWDGCKCRNGGETLGQKHLPSTTKTEDELECDA